MVEFSRKNFKLPDTQKKPYFSITLNIPKAAAIYVSPPGRGLEERWDHISYGLKEDKFVPS